VSALLVPRVQARNDIEPDKEFYTVVYSPKPVVLDGDLSEWAGVPVLSDPKFAVPKFSGTNASPNYVLFEVYSGGTWSGPDDQTSAVQISYDDNNVYFGFVVTDDYHENMSGNAWNGDSIQLMIADATRTQQIALYNYALLGYEDKSGNFVPDPNATDPVLVNHEAGPGGDANCNCPTQAVIKRDSKNHKTTYEIKLPMASLGLTNLHDGHQFGLGMAINDGDGYLDTATGIQYGEAGQEGQKGWGGLGAHSIVFGKTPSETALVTLTKNNDIEPTKQFYTALKTTKPVVLDGSLSEWSGIPVLSDPKFAVPKYSGTNASPNYVLFEVYSGGTWSGPDDQTSAVQIAYDDNNVYFGFVVTDDYHENMSGNAWNGDSIQLMIADAGRTNQVGLYNYALLGYEDKTGAFVPDPNATNPVLVNHEAGPGGDANCNCPTDAMIKRDSVNHKTIYEIKLPVGSLGLTGPLTNGTQFGLGMAINDGDGWLDTATGTQYGQAGQEGQKGWGGLGAHSIVFGKTPSETALVTLGTTASGTDVFFLSAIDPNVLGFSFRATDKGTSIVDPTSAKLTIDNKTVPLTYKKTLDATDFTYTAATPIALDSNHSYAILVKDTLGNVVTDQGTFKIGSYKVGLNFGIDQTGATLNATDVAGVPAVAQAYWNNFSGNASPTDANGNPTPSVVQSDQGANSATTINVLWNAAATMATTGAGLENNKFTGTDTVLMTGYLDTGDSSTTQVTLTRIPVEFTAAGYDVYVYTLDGNPGAGGGYRITGTNGTVLKDYVLFTNPTNPSTYAEVAQGGGRATGNYIHFTGLHASDIIIEATSQSPQGAGTLHRAPINAIQLVPGPQAAPAPSLSVARSGNNLTIQWSPPGGTLQSTPALGGTPTWTAVGTTNPATVPIGTTGNTFYRVKQ
jgi:hypothetical protein